jgi:glutamate synthase domain-containing protein 3
MQDVRSALQTKKKIFLSYKVRNIHRSIGTRLSGAIAYRLGEEGLPDDTINITLQGSAGQSLGAFLAKGISLKLEGEANDYVGKGLCGGKIILVPNNKVTFNPSTNIICGNTVLYGATDGKMFVYGRAGERFAVRNSGATAVVEGVGDHACEYMTQGTVVVLGTTGKNFGGGMTGGMAYVFDESGLFPQLCNKDSVQIENLKNEGDISNLHALIAEHCDTTKSNLASSILNQWQSIIEKFYKVTPLSSSK